MDMLQSTTSDVPKTNINFTSPNQNTHFDPDIQSQAWVRTSPADLYYIRINNKEVKSTTRLDQLCCSFKDQLIHRNKRVRETQIAYEPTLRKRPLRICSHHSENFCSSSDSDTDIDDLEDDCTMEELTKKISHPYRLHKDLWHNEAGEMNDGPLCRCSVKSRRSGIRHGIYPGETGFLKCDPNSNNAHSLYHYR